MESHEVVLPAWWTYAVQKERENLIDFCATINQMGVWLANNNESADPVLISI